MSNRKLQLVGFIGLLLCSVSSHALKAGDPAPEFTQPYLLKDGELSLSEYQGKVVYVDFWASWCPPCRIAMPLINELRTELVDKGEAFEVIGVNVDQEVEDGKKFLDKYPVSFPTVSDIEGKLPEQYQVKGMPSSFLIDQKGAIYKVHTGFRKSDFEKIKAEILEILEKQRAETK
ncbi:MAG: TlpA disulfide reductase family protein [Pseudomonadota bacterium]